MYPDIDDILVTTRVLTEDFNDGGLEDQYFELAIQLLAQNDKNFLLDAGCGKGRFLPLFARVFNNIIAIDPDPDRLRASETLWRNIEEHRNCSVKFQNEFIQTFISDVLFDCILCSHIIQHVKTDDVEKILFKLNDLLRPKGKLFLLTTNWPESNDSAFSIIDSASDKEQLVTENEFNEYIEAQNIHCLLAQYFSERILTDLLQNAGFEIIFIKKYHGYPKTRGDNFIFAEKK